MGLQRGKGEVRGEEGEGFLSECGEGRAKIRICIEFKAGWNYE